MGRTIDIPLWALRAARAGAEFLSEQLPRGWEDPVNLATLDQGSTTDCVLAQVWAGWFEHTAVIDPARAERFPSAFEMALHDLRLNPVMNLMDRTAETLGFDRPVTHASKTEEFAALTAAWRHVITERRQALIPSSEEEGEDP